MKKEEIDIIELFERVKNGNAPRKIKIDGKIYKFNKKHTCLNNMYLLQNEIFRGTFLLNILNDFNAKVEIVADKPKPNINIVFKEGI